MPVIVNAAGEGDCIDQPCSDLVSFRRAAAGAVAGVPAKPPKSVLTMSIREIGMLVGMIGLMGMYHRRRRLEDPTTRLTRY